MSAKRRDRVAAWLRLQEGNRAGCIRNPGTVWGSLCEIDYRTKVGSEAWYARHVPRLRRLSAWRRLHMLDEHGGVRDYRYKQMRDWMRLIKRLELNNAATSEG